MSYFVGIMIAVGWPVAVLYNCNWQSECAGVPAVKPIAVQRSALLAMKAFTRSSVAHPVKSKAIAKYFAIETSKGGIYA